MPSVDIRAVDLSMYQSAPTLTAIGTWRLMQDLIGAKPEDAGESVEKAAGRMLETADEINDILLSRVENAGADSMAEFEFDVFSDRMWNDARGELAHRMHYADPAANQIGPEAAEQINLPHRQAMAKVAEELHNHLFGQDGNEFLGLAFPEQVQHMATRLEWIHASPKEAAYREVLGEGMLATLDAVQVRYDQMVHGRETRNKSTGDLRQLRNTAQRRIAIYASTVLAAMDEEDRASVDAALNALQPIRSARTRASKAAGSGGSVGDEPELIEGEPESES